MSPLTPQQATFVAEYIKSGNATEAALKAKYSEKSAASIGSRLLRNVKISEAIQVGLASIAKESEVTVISLMRDLEEVKRRCMQAEPVLDNEGNQTGEWKFDSRGALKAIELQGKKLGMFEAQKEKPPIDLPPLSGGELSTTQLIQLILEKRAKLERGPNAVQVQSATGVHVREQTETREAIQPRDPELPSFAGLQEFPTDSK